MQIASSLQRFQNEIAERINYLVTASGGCYKSRPSSFSSVQPARAADLKRQVSLMLKLTLLQWELLSGRDSIQNRERVATGCCHSTDV